MPRGMGRGKVSLRILLLRSVPPNPEAREDFCSEFWVQGAQSECLFFLSYGHAGAGAVSAGSFSRQDRWSFFQTGACSQTRLELQALGFGFSFDGGRASQISELKGFRIHRGAGGLVTSLPGLWSPGSGFGIFTWHGEGLYWALFFSFFFFFSCHLQKEGELEREENG